MAASIGIKTPACCLCRIPSLFVRKTTKALFLRRCQSKAIIAGETDIDPLAIDKMRERGVTFKGHPGVMILKPVNMPERMERAVETVLEKYPVSNLNKKSEQLNNYLHSRHPPAEEKHLQRTAQQMYNNLIEEGKTEGVDMSAMTEDEQEKYQQKVQHKVMKKLRSSQYHWRPINFDAPTSLVYLRARMAYNYSVFLQCFSEISRREPEFRPRAMFDLGSGLGSSVWAANKVWGTSVFEYYCVDSSRDMNTLARLLLQDGEEQKLMHIHGVYFRQFSPSPAQNSFNLVVCGHTLLELPGKQERLASVAALWKMTEDFLVLVENGTTAGFTVINEAKEYILHLSDEKEKMGHVFAPCPHDEPCPKLHEKKSPCMFPVSYKPGQLSAQKGSKSKQSSRYSYIIMRKGPREEDDVQWPRVIQEVIKSSRHVHCHLCCPDMSLSHEVLTQKKHGRNVYKCARYSNWGDLFPVRLPKVDQDASNKVHTVTTDTTSCGINHRSVCDVDTERTESRNENYKSDSQQHPPHHNPLVL